MKKIAKLALSVFVAAVSLGCAELPKQNTAFSKVGVTKEEAARDAYLCAGKNDRPYFTAQCMERKGYTIVPSEET
ncbi:hypothetical protein [Pseudoduganella sp. R-43]|uniref:hypothetical protein n=1 Tax=Pseudoduganella sp. R-43 TaxID=3404063 RepID=UPI003CEA255D